MQTTAETIDTAPLGHLVGAIIDRLNPLTPTRPPKPTTPAALLEYRGIRRLARSLTAADVGETIGGEGGNLYPIRAISRYLRDGREVVQIETPSGSRTFSPASEVVTWGLYPALQRAVRTPAEVEAAREQTAFRAAEYEAERLAAEAAAEAKAAAHRPLHLQGYLAGLEI